VGTQQIFLGHTILQKIISVGQNVIEIDGLRTSSSSAPSDSLSSSLTMPSTSGAAAFPARETTS
jgi:hypothetical protein